jgi:hypothetical protein
MFHRICCTSHWPARAGMVSRALQVAADEAAAAAKAGAMGITKLVGAVVPLAELEASKIECARLTDELKLQRQQLEEAVPKTLLEVAESAALTAKAEIKLLQSRLEQTVPIETLVAAQDESSALWLKFYTSAVYISNFVCLQQFFIYFLI